MSDLQELYQELILDHNRNPRNFGEMDDPSHHAHGHNPLCGDKIEVFLQVEDDVVKKVRFVCAGCAISKASASLMAEHLEGRSVADVTKLFTSAHRMLTGENSDPDDTQTLGKIVALAGVSEFPMRVKCATLAWHTLQAALDDGEREVTTE